MFDIREHGGIFGGITKTEFIKNIKTDEDTLDIKLMDKMGDISQDGQYVVEGLNCYLAANYSVKKNNTPLATGVISGATNTTIIAVGKNYAYGYYIITSSNFGLFSLELATGIVKLQSGTGDYSGILASKGWPLMIGGVPHILIYNTSALKLCLYTENFNTLVWEVTPPVGIPYLDIVITASGVLAITYENRVYSVNISTGALTVVRDNNADGGFRYSLVEAKDGNIIVCSNGTHNNVSKKLYCLDANTKAVIWSVFVSRKTIFVKTVKNEYAFIQAEFYNGNAYGYYMYFNKVTGVKRTSSEKNQGFSGVGMKINKKYATIGINGGSGALVVKIEG